MSLPTYSWYTVTNDIMNVVLVDFPNTLVARPEVRISKTKPSRPRPGTLKVTIHDHEHLRRDPGVKLLVTIFCLGLSNCGGFHKSEDLLNVFTITTNTNSRPLPRISVTVPSSFTSFPWNSFFNCTLTIFLTSLLQNLKFSCPTRLFNFLSFDPPWTSYILLNFL